MGRTPAAGPAGAGSKPARGLAPNTTSLSKCGSNIVQTDDFGVPSIISFDSPRFKVRTFPRCPRSPALRPGRAWLFDAGRLGASRARARGLTCAHGVRSRVPRKRSGALASSSKSCFRDHAWQRRGSIRSCARRTMCGGERSSRRCCACARRSASHAARARGGVRSRSPRRRRRRRCFPRAWSASRR